MTYGNIQKFPSYNGGGGVPPAAALPEVGGDITGKKIGSESALSNWVGPYVTNMLGQGQALGNQAYQGYSGPLTAGESAGQSAAFQGIAGLDATVADMGAFAPTSFTGTGIAQQYMNPFVQSALEPQLAEARRQAEIQRVANAGRLTQAGAYGGSRQAVMESEGDRNLQRQLADITGRGYESAYDRGAQQFNVEQGQGQGAQDALNKYGLAALSTQADLGATQRDIEQQGVAADYAQFREERDFPYKQVQYMQSLLSGLPLATQSYTYAEPSRTSQIAALGGGASALYDSIFGGGSTSSAPTASSVGAPPVQIAGSAAQDFSNIG